MKRNINSNFGNNNSTTGAVTNKLNTQNIAEKTLNKLKVFRRWQCTTDTYLWVNEPQFSWPPQKISKNLNGNACINLPAKKSLKSVKF